jgi:hypothetical protein
MAKKGAGGPRAAGAGAARPTRTILELAFEGNQAPAQLSVAIVSLVELCEIAMPDPAKIRESLLGAGFEVGKKARADEAGRMLALDNKFVATPLRNLRHELYGKERHGAPVLILLSEADAKEGKLVFCSAIFRGALEADAVKAVAHVTKLQPITGSTARNADGNVLRRVFWDVKDVAGVRGLVVTGPGNVEATELPRAFTAFNRVKR